METFMSNQSAKDQGRFQHQDGEGDENRNLWQSRDERDEDGGWGRREEQSSRNLGMGRNERDFGNSSSGSGQRGYGRAIYGESGLGERNRDERWGQGWDRGQGVGSSGGYGQGSSGGFGARTGYNQGSSRGFGSSGGYGQGSSGYSPTGLDRDRLAAQRDQGFRARDFGGAGFSGRGPKDYKRTDERVREDVCDRLSRDDEVDASEISVRVENGEVTLEGSVETRAQKHQAEDIAADVSGVNDVHNNVRVRKSVLNELKDKVTGQEQRTGGHAGSGTKDTLSSNASQSEQNGH
jgi:hypothetical protein